MLLPYAMWMKDIFPVGCLETDIAVPKQSGMDDKLSCACDKCPVQEKTIQRAPGEVRCFLICIGLL